MTRGSGLGRWVACGALGAALAFVPVARAGYQEPAPVTITATQAWGSAGSARNSNDGKQRIDCEFLGTTAAVGIYCWATDLNGTQKTCGNSTASFVSAAQKFQPDSFIRFNFDASATCTQLEVLTASQNEPKRP